VHLCYAAPNTRHRPAPHHTHHTIPPPTPPTPPPPPPSGIAHMHCRLVTHNVTGTRMPLGCIRLNRKIHKCEKRPTCTWRTYRARRVTRRTESDERRRTCQHGRRMRPSLYGNVNRWRTMHRCTYASLRISSTRASYPHTCTHMHAHSYPHPHPHSRAPTHTLAHACYAHVHVHINNEAALSLGGLPHANLFSFYFLFSLATLPPVQPFHTARTCMPT
jgi:hypothetical protein